MNIKTFGPVDDRSLKQLETCMQAGDAEFGVLCADHHPGYSQPIGGGIAYEGYVSPSGVGYDIGCIAAGARVTTCDGTARPIEEVGPSDAVACIDRAGMRPVVPNYGSVARGRRSTLELVLANARTLRLTPDHLVRTERGWVEAAKLEPPEALLCSPFVGLPSRPFELPPALLRVLAYVSGDGHLSKDGKQVSMYTTVEADAAALALDLGRLGYSARLYRRQRGAGRRPEILVRAGSVALHRRLADLGSPVGKKRWPEQALNWLFDAPAWARAHFLSAFASAEMSTPRLVESWTANHAISRRIFEQRGSSSGCWNRLASGARLRRATRSGSCRSSGARTSSFGSWKRSAFAWLPRSAVQQPWRRVLRGNGERCSERESWHGRRHEPFVLPAWRTAPSWSTWRDVSTYRRGSSITRSIPIERSDEG